MPRENNYLIGRGEMLTYEVDVPSGGNPKSLPYDFVTQRDRIDSKLSATYDYIRGLPQEACPGNQAVAIVTMHPRFVSKSDFPENLLRAVGLRAIGSRQAEIAPERWGVKNHPDKASTDELFVAGARTAFAQWAGTVKEWTDNTGTSGALKTIETISAFQAESKVQSIPQDREDVMLEVILHNDDSEEVIQSFIAYAEILSASVYKEKRRDVGGLTFFPVETSRSTVLEIARHSFVRVARGMPPLRPLNPTLTRVNTDDQTFDIGLPDGPPIDERSEAVIFDGGIPANVRTQLAPWVSLTEPPGIGPATPDCESHGLAVTSAFLFGPLSPTGIVDRPFSRVNHVRVLDRNNGSSRPPDFEYIETIDRITSHLDENQGRYRLVNISIGPDIPVSDDEVSYWTLALDQRFASSKSVVTIAVGNGGSRDEASGLNRIQPPSDAVNVLSVGATDRPAGSWSRADYSSVGPGRSPGLVKPDGVAFGGSASYPFHVVDTVKSSRPVIGTSFAAPLSLRSSAGIDVQLGTSVDPLTIRALMVHWAEDGNNDRVEVGWGKFEIDPDMMITCPDDEPVIIYQGILPAGTHLRAPIPMPDTPPSGMVTITATMVIAPEISPGFTSSYTRSGFEAIFRPHNGKFTNHSGGKQSKHPTTKTFFSESSMYGKGEYELREGGLKWEPCAKRIRRFQAKSLSGPVFDLYNHSREEGSRSGGDNPVPYALIIGVKAPNIPDLYNQIVRAYQSILTPIVPRIRLRV